MKESMFMKLFLKKRAVMEEIKQRQSMIVNRVRSQGLYILYLITLATLPVLEVKLLLYLFSI
jgi:hypothetical protein